MAPTRTDVRESLTIITGLENPGSSSAVHSRLRSRRTTPESGRADETEYLFRCYSEPVSDTGHDG